MVMFILFHLCESHGSDMLTVCYSVFFLTVSRICDKLLSAFFKFKEGFLPLYWEQSVKF